MSKWRSAVECFLRKLDCLGHKGCFLLKCSVIISAMTFSRILLITKNNSTGWYILVCLTSFLVHGNRETTTTTTNTTIFQLFRTSAEQTMTSSLEQLPRTHFLFHEPNTSEWEVDSVVRFSGVKGGDGDGVNSGIEMVMLTSKGFFSEGFFRYWFCRCSAATGLGEELRMKS